MVHLILKKIVLQKKKGTKHIFQTWWDEKTSVALEVEWLKCHLEWIRKLNIIKLQAHCINYRRVHYAFKIFNRYIQWTVPISALYVQFFRYCFIHLIVISTKFISHFRWLVDKSIMRVSIMTNAAV
jgi:hypothetical protein